jgi:hypothetical protein
MPAYLAEQAVRRALFPGARPYHAPLTPPLLPPSSPAGQVQLVHRLHQRALHDGGADGHLWRHLLCIRCVLQRKLPGNPLHFHAHVPRKLRRCALPSRGRPACRLPHAVLIVRYSPSRFCKRRPRPPLPPSYPSPPPPLPQDWPFRPPLGAHIPHSRTAARGIADQQLGLVHLCLQ